MAHFGPYIVKTKCTLKLPDVYSSLFSLLHYMLRAEIQANLAQQPAKMKWILSMT